MQEWVESLSTAVSQYHMAACSLMSVILSGWAFWRSRQAVNRSQTDSATVMVSTCPDGTVVLTKDGKVVAAVPAGSQAAANLTRCETVDSPVQQTREKTKTVLTGKKTSNTESQEDGVPGHADEPRKWPEMRRVLACVFAVLGLGLIGDAVVMAHLSAFDVYSLPAWAIVSPFVTGSLSLGAGYISRYSQT